MNNLSAIKTPPSLEIEWWPLRSTTTMPESNLSQVEMPSKTVDSSVMRPISENWKYRGPVNPRVCRRSKREILVARRDDARGYSVERLCPLLSKVWTVDRVCRPASGTPRPSAESLFQKTTLMCGDPRERSGCLDLAL